MPATPLNSAALSLLAKDSSVWGGLHGAGLALSVANLLRSQKDFITLVVPDTHSAELLAGEIRFFLGQAAEQLLHLPDWETLPYDLFSPAEEIVSERLQTLQALTRYDKGLLIVPVSTLMQRLPPKNWLLANSLDISVGQTLDLTPFRDQLGGAGYRTVSEVMTHGEFAVRGSILDMFPMGSGHPYRIDLFDDEIESIRRFDPETQRSLDKIEQISLLPAHEFPLDENGIKTFRNQYRSQFEGDPQKSPVYKNISQGTLIGGVEYYLPLFFDRTDTLFDYLPENTLLCKLDDPLSHAGTFFSGVEHRYEQRRHDLERPVLQPKQLYITTDELTTLLDQQTSLELQRFKSRSSESTNFSCKAVQVSTPVSGRVDRR